MPIFIQLLFALERAAAGLRQHAIQVEDHRIVYAEGGHGETILLLHGFGAQHSTWNRFAKFLTPSWRVIAPDLPGWGASTRLRSASYGYGDQIQRLHHFVRALKLERFHLLGHSMGGCLAAYYAAFYPDEPVTLCLVAPHGILEPRESELRKAIQRGENWLLVSSPADFDRLQARLFEKPPFAPKAILRYLERDAVARCPQNREIFERLQNPEMPLLRALPQISAPVLVLWGERDRFIDASAAEVFASKIPNARVQILAKVGHMPTLENAQQCAQAYLDFLQSATNQSKI